MRVEYPHERGQPAYGYSTEPVGKVDLRPGAVNEVRKNGIMTHTRDTLRKDVDRAYALAQKAADIANRLAGSMPEAVADCSSAPVGQPCLAGDYVEIAVGLARALSLVSEQLERIEGTL